MTSLALPDELRPDAPVQLVLDPEAFAIVHGLADAGVITLVSLHLPDEFPYDQAESLAAYWGVQSRGLQWWIGDLLNEAERRYGHEYAQLAEATGLSEGALQRRMYVCREVPVKRRRAGLPFSVHLAVASLGARDQERWLKVAAEEQLTAAVLRERIKGVTKEREQPLFDDDDDTGDHLATDTKLVVAAARAVLRDAKPAGDDQHYLIPNEDVARLKAAFGEE